MEVMDKETASWQGIATLAVVALASHYCYTYCTRKRERIRGIPHVPSKLPFIGYGSVYFTSICQSSVKLRQLYGDIYTLQIFGRLYCKIYDPKDIDQLFKMPEKRASLIQAYMDLAGPSLPQPDRSVKRNASEKLSKLLDPLTHSGTPMIAHSVRPQNLKTWVPEIRTVFQQRFDKLPPKGEVDLFDWCRDLISVVTVRMMLGSKVAKDEALLRNFVDLFNQSDPERGFAGPMTALATIAEVAWRGERKVYVQVRELLFPLIDQQIKACHERNGADDGGDSSALSSMVQNWYHRKLNGNLEEVQLARTRIANDLFNFTFAAFSNSFGMAAWVLFHYLRDTNGLQKILRDELLETTTNTTTTTDNSIPQCPKLEATILEIGRLYTPGDVHRKLLHDWTLPSNPKITIPRGTIMLTSTLVAMRDPTKYTTNNPYELDITRDYKSAGTMFMPFGTGSHPCVGKKFALLEIALLASEAIQQLDMELVVQDNNNNNNNVVEECAFTNQMIQGIPNHPPCDLAQPGFIWRPAVPIKIKYEKKGDEI